MRSGRVEKVVIVGGGTAGWMVAASLSRFYKNTLKIQLIESSEIGTIGVGEATTATIRRFYGALGVSDLDVLRSTGGTVKLGIKFKNWYKKDSEYFHPFGLYGQDLSQIGFHHFWLKLKNSGKASPNIGDYSLGASLALANKFTPPSPNPASTLSIFDWAVHFDASLFGVKMREIAEANGVARIDSKVLKVNINQDDGFIDSLLLGNGLTIEGDLFIDCSGFKGLLIEDALKTGYEEWSEWLLCDRAIAVQSTSSEEPSPYTLSTAHQAGWQWKIPLQHRHGNGHVYASQYISDDEANSVLCKNINGELLGEPRLIKFKPGRRKKAWNKNCIAVGLASGFLEPLESTAIALVETAIEKIRLLFPDKSMSQGCVDEFNDMTKREYERVRDFIILHYHATQRDDSPMWNYVRTMNIPQTLLHKIRLFRERGHLVKYRWEIFQPASWIALYTGNNILPQFYDQRVDTFDEEYLVKSLAEMKKSINVAVTGVGTHAQFLAENCAEKLFGN